MQQPAKLRTCKGTIGSTPILSAILEGLSIWQAQQS